MRPLILSLTAALLLAACATTDPAADLSPTISPPEPIAQTVRCPASALADLQPEPGAPTGDLSPAQVRAGLIAALGPVQGDLLFEWVAIRFPIWGRSGWARAEEFQTWCKANGF